MGRVAIELAIIRFVGLQHVYDMHACNMHVTCNDGGGLSRVFFLSVYCVM